MGLVQSKQNSGSGTSLTVTLDSATTAGNALIVVLAGSAVTSNPSSVSSITLGGVADNFAQLSTFGTTVDAATGYYWLDPNCAGGQTSIVITTAGSSGTNSIMATVYEWSGLYPFSPYLDQSAGALNTGTSWTVSTPTTTAASEVWIGAIFTLAASAGTITGPSTPWTNLAQVSFTNGSNLNRWMSGYQVVSSTGVDTYAGTVSTSSEWIAGAIALKLDTGGPYVQTFTSSGTWLCPAGVTSVQVECWGGGGTGGMGTGNPAEGGGGAGGSYARTNSYAVTPGNTYTVTVGAATAAQTTTSVVNGNDSWFDSTSGVIAKGGAGGTAATTNSSNGTGGLGSTTGCIGDVVFAGGNGADGAFSSSLAGGAGGGGAGSTAVGGNASGNTGGIGGSVGGGAGSNGVADSTAGTAGTAPGGGGSAGDANTTTDRNGGAGARGQVVLTFSTSSSSNISDSDTSTGTDTESITAATPDSDTGTGTDTEAIAATSSDSDTGSGAENTPTIGVTDSDSSTGVDTEAVTLGASDSDAPTGTDTESVAATLSDSDTSTGADTEAITASVSDSDTSTGTDTESSVQGANDSEANAGTESQSIAATSSDTDTSTGADTEAVSANVSDSDTSTGTDTESVSQSGSNVSDADAPTGTDTESVAATLSDSDTGIGTDTESVAATTSDSDTSAGSETFALNVQVSDSDSSTAVDTESFTIGNPTTPGDSDPVTGGEFWSIVIANMPVSERNLVMGPGSLYIGAFGAVEPANGSVGSAPDPLVWTDLGGILGGVELTVEQEWVDVQLKQVLETPMRRVKKRRLSVKTQLAEPSLANLAYALNDSAPVSGAFEPTARSDASALTYNALIVDGWAPGYKSGGRHKRRRIIIRKALSIDNVELQYSKDGQSVYTVTWSCHYVSGTISPFRVIDES